MHFIIPHRPAGALGIPSTQFTVSALDMASGMVKVYLLESTGGLSRGDSPFPIAYPTAARPH